LRRVLLEQRPRARDVFDRGALVTYREAQDELAVQLRVRQKHLSRSVYRIEKLGIQ
jgi:hypothetical protein